MRKPNNKTIMMVIIGTISIYAVSGIMISLLDCKDAISMTPEECEKHYAFGWNYIVPIMTIGLGTFWLIITPQINIKFSRDVNEKV